ncbi:MAG: C40 family peptidase [Jatrophihabitans sp.]|uniref:C40 family peptidase n=1 Tax=Jatrophihabitans sp. TaxID=1932789 RepID=UPI003F804875
MSRRALLSAMLAVGAVSGSVLVPATANAASAPRLQGHLGAAVQNSADHSLFVRGFAFDAQRPNRPIQVTIVGDGKVLGTVTTATPLPVINRTFHLGGNHGFRVTLHPRTQVRTVTLVAHAWHATAVRPVSAVRASQVNPGARVIAEARRFVGVTPYVYGGASPRGFDCSGFAMYVYQHAGVASLPHSAQAQMTSRRVRLIPRSAARPGDLIFYLSGGYAYHVAIFAGHGMDYAATQPGERIKYQRIWGSNLRFGTTWH